MADQLHILVFLDLGMHPTLTQIAALRLAPVQCLSPVRVNSCEGVIPFRIRPPAQWRKSIVAQIVANHDRLYDDKTCVEALEAFYERVVEDYPGKPDFT